MMNMKTTDMKSGGMMEKPMMTEPEMRQIMGQMANTEMDDFEPIEADIPTMAEDGERVCVMCVGKAKDGKLMDVKATEFDMGEMPGLKNMLSEKEDGDNQEDE